MLCSVQAAGGGEQPKEAEVEEDEKPEVEETTVQAALADQPNEAGDSKVSTSPLQDAHIWLVWHSCWLVKTFKHIAYHAGRSYCFRNFVFLCSLVLFVIHRIMACRQ